MAIKDNRTKPTPQPDMGQPLHTDPVQPQPAENPNAPGYVPTPGDHVSNAYPRHGVLNAMDAMFNQTYANNFGEQAAPQGFDWANVSALIPYHVNVNPAAQAVTNLERVIREYFDENLSPSLNIDIIVLDKESVYNLNISLLVFVVKETKNKNTPIAYHTLLVEASIDPIPPRTVTISGNRQVEVMQLTSDMYTPQMMNIIDKEIRSRYENHEHVFTADAEVIPRNFDLTNEENIRRVTINAALACRAQLCIANPKFPDINLAYARRDSATLAQTTVFGKDTEEDQVGSPIRSDIIITTTAIPNYAKDPNGVDYYTQPVNQFQNHPVITRATGYIDLVYDDSMSHNSYNTYAQQYTPYVAMPTPVFTANLVLTQLTNVRIQTLPGLLLALVNASLIRENLTWLPALMPNHADNDVISHDIGSIGYDVSVTGDDKFQKIITTPDQFNMKHLMDLYHQFFHKGLAVSLDIPECSAHSWMYQPLGQAACADYPVKQAALDTIRTAANILTNGGFERYYAQYKGTGEFVFSHQNRIHLGYYEAKSARRDIRDLDYLAVAGIAGAKTREEIATYTDTYNSSWDVSERLAHRRAFIQAYLGANVTFTGFAQRVTFEPVFLNALTAAVAETNYTIVPQQTRVDGFRDQRANGGYITGAAIDAATTGILRQNTMGYNGGGGYAGRYSLF